MPAPEALAAPPRPWRHRAMLLLRVALSAAALAWVLQHIELADTSGYLGQAPPWTWVLPAGLLVLNSAVHALRLKLLLDGTGPAVPLLQVLLALLKGNFLGVVLPTGGAEVAKIGFLARPCGSGERALAAILVARLLELLPWTLLLLWGLAWGLWEHDRLVAAAAVVFALAFSAVLLLSLVLVRWGEPLLARLPQGLLARLPRRIRGLGQRVRAAFSQVGADRRRLLLSGLLTVPFSLVNCLVVFVIVRGYGLDLAYLDVLALVPAVDTLIALPISVGGLGVREGLFVDLLAPWGATQSLGVAVALTRWAAELGRAAVGGVIFVLHGASRP